LIPASGIFCKNLMHASLARLRVVTVLMFSPIFFPKFEKFENADIFFQFLESKKCLSGEVEGEAPYYTYSSQFQI
jgi:hypothetical protein